MADIRGHAWHCPVCGRVNMASWADSDVFMPKIHECECRAVVNVYPGGRIVFLRLGKLKVQP